MKWGKNSKDENKLKLKENFMKIIEKTMRIYKKKLIFKMENEENINKLNSILTEFQRIVVLLESFYNKTILYEEGIGIKELTNEKLLNCENILENTLENIKKEKFLRFFNNECLKNNENFKSLIKFLYLNSLLKLKKSTSNIFPKK